MFRFSASFHGSTCFVHPLTKTKLQNNDILFGVGSKPAHDSKSSARFMATHCSVDVSLLRYYSVYVVVVVVRCFMASTTVLYYMLP